MPSLAERFSEQFMARRATDQNASGRFKKKEIDQIFGISKNLFKFKPFGSFKIPIR